MGNLNRQLSPFQERNDIEMERKEKEKEKKRKNIIQTHTVYTLMVRLFIL